MINAVSSAFGGLQAASAGFERSVGAVVGAGAGTGGTDLVTAVTDTLAARDQVDLSTAVLRVALDAQKRVLDILV